MPPRRRRRPASGRSRHRCRGILPLPVPVVRSGVLRSCHGLQIVTNRCVTKYDEVKSGNDADIPPVTGITPRGGHMAIGRPREFDPDRVEDAAMRLFWARGFDGVSISDVSDATGVNRRSIYAEFDSKE